MEDDGDGDESVSTATSKIRSCCLSKLSQSNGKASACQWKIVSIVRMIVGNIIAKELYVCAQHMSVLLATLKENVESYRNNLFVRKNQNLHSSTSCTVRSPFQNYITGLASLWSTHYMFDSRPTQFVVTHLSRAQVAELKVS